MMIFDSLCVNSRIAGRRVLNGKGVSVFWNAGRSFRDDDCVYIAISGNNLRAERNGDARLLRGLEESVHTPGLGTKCPSNRI